MSAGVAGSTPAARQEVIMTRTILLALALCFACGLNGTAQAQTETYPNRPIKVIIPFPAGGPTDGMARIISDRLGAVLGQVIVIENRGGAGGSIGGKMVATADPDGYTILLTPGGSLTTGPAVHKNIGYDAAAFAPVRVNPGSTARARSWADLPAQAVKYVRRLEELIERPIALVSTSPERDDVILMRDPFSG